jgi:hypothetical protein
MSVGGSGGETFGATCVVDEHRVDERRVDEHWRRAPAEPLRPYVAWYTGYRQRGVPPAVHRGLPSPFLTLILTLDEPLTMAAHADQAHLAREFRLLAGCPPSQWLAEEFRNVQAGAWLDEGAWV